MILFRHTRWRKFKTAWVWFHYDQYFDYVLRKKRIGQVYYPGGKRLHKVKWDGLKPYILWEPSAIHKEDPKRYLSPEGKILGRSSMWSCAYPERPLWYPAKDPFTKEDYDKYEMPTQAAPQQFVPNVMPAGLLLYGGGGVGGRDYGGHVQALQNVQWFNQEGIAGAGDLRQYQYVGAPVVDPDPAIEGVNIDDWPEDDDPDHGEGH